MCHEYSDLILGHCLWGCVCVILGPRIPYTNNGVHRQVPLLRSSSRQTRYLSDSLGPGVVWIETRSKVLARPVISGVRIPSSYLFLHMPETNGPTLYRV